MRVRRQRLMILGGAIVVAATAIGFFLIGRQAEARYVSAPADRGDVADVVGATGMLQAVTTVQVGSQVSGTIQSLYADFNSVVRKGEVLARLDPSLFQARLGQAQANLVSARANVERARSAVDDAKQKFERARELAAQNLLPQSDLDTAKANYDSAVAQLKANQAAVTQAAAAVNQAQVDLQHTIITAPISGVVIGRNVDVGQTVAASFQAPVLFVIANDLSQMQVKASIDEADVGRVRTGQDVTFRVDSFPDQVFRGTVQQVRLQPTTVQNVVTYDAIIAVENPDQKLMPGMTATVSIIVRQSKDALRIPAAALRFRPEGFEPGMRAQGGPGGPRMGPAGGGESGGTAPGGVQGRPGAGGWRRQGGPGGGQGRPQGRGSAGGPEGVAAASGAVPGGTDGNFGPGSAAGRPALVFVVDQAGRPQPTRVRVGISDGQHVEVLSGLEEGTRVITGVEGEGARTPARGASPAANPFQPQFQRRQR